MDFIIRFFFFSYYAIKHILVVKAELLTLGAVPWGVEGKQNLHCEKDLGKSCFKAETWRTVKDPGTTKKRSQASFAEGKCEYRWRRAWDQESSDRGSYHSTHP